MSNSITNNHSKQKHISISQIINHNMSQKKNKSQQLISLYTQGLRSILVKCYSIKRVKQVKRIPCDKYHSFETLTGPYDPTGKTRTTYFCGSFSLKNRSMGKKQGSVRTAVKPHSSKNRDQTASHDSLLPFESELKKKKKTHTHTHKNTKTSFKFCFQSTSCSFLSSETLLLGKANFKFCHCHLQHHSFKFWLCSPPVM